MSKLTIAQAVQLIPVSESTLRRDLKSGKVSFDTNEKGRKQIDTAELTRVYGQLKDKEPVNDTRQNLSMNGNDTCQSPSMNGNENAQIVTLLEAQVQDLKAQLANAVAEKQQLLELANNIQKQNELLMLPPPREKSRFFERLKTFLTHTDQV